MKTQYLFFSGKGGVGKTSMACTSALRYADSGKRTLIVTTDPASNLADVFEQPIGHKISKIQGAPNLWAMEIDPDQSTQEYVDRAMKPIRTAFPPQMVKVMEEQMSGPCTAEVAVFDRFTDFLELPPENGRAFDVVIFDTAPTGHTLRLLELPAEWSKSIDNASAGSGQTCIGPAAAIQDAKHKYERALATLRDPSQTTFIFVLHPEAIAIKETKRAIDELDKLNIHTHQIIINGIIPATEKGNPLFAARAGMQSLYIKQIQKELPIPTRKMVLLAVEIKGLLRLREVGKIFFDGAHPVTDCATNLSNYPGSSSPAAELVARITPHGSLRRTVFFAGKGGVGKTVASCLTAVWLAGKGYKTLLLTTDPAAHLGDVLGMPVGDIAAPVCGQANLWAAKIDPKSAANAYKTRILEDARRRGRSAEAVKIMAEELDSPCTEEMAAFDRFIDYASQSEWQVIVFDTAPTGHTLRLIELPMDWSQQLDVKAFSSVEMSAADEAAKGRFTRVINMMRDPKQSTFAYVMLPESTPILEAFRASQELKTVGIEPGLIVANQVIPSNQATTPFVEARRAMQEKYLSEIKECFSAPILQIPLLSSEIKGLKMLSELGTTLYGEMVLDGLDPVAKPQLKPL